MEAEAIDGIAGVIAGEAVPGGFFDGSPHILSSARFRFVGAL